MRPPKNLIIEDQYTSGNEFLTEPMYENYVGFYHSVSGKQFIGAKYSINAPSLIPYTEDKIVPAYEINNIDKTYLNLKPNVANLVKIDNFPIKRVYYQSTVGEQVRYFIQKINQINSPIIEVDRTTFNYAKNNNFYKTVSLLWSSTGISYIDINFIEKQLPGISKFLGLS